MAKRKIIPYRKDLKEKARSLRKQMTLPEVLLWNKLKNFQMMGYDFDRQKPLDSYIVDFYCKDLQLVIEIDGDYHNQSDAAEYDYQRQEKLELFGLKFLRFSERIVQKDMTEVLDHISNWIIEFAPQIDCEFQLKYNNPKRVY
jgi:very-short-patch-repair endonuclease